MRHLSPFALLALLVPFLAAPAAAQKVKDDSTGIAFDATQKVDGTTFQCLGAGVRKVFVVKAYAVAFCLEQGAAAKTVQAYVQKAHPTAKGDDLVDALEDDPKFYENLALAAGDKLVLMKVVRDIGRDKLASAFRDSLSEVLPKAKVDKLIDAIPSDVKEGQTVRLFSQGNKLTIDIAGNVKTLEDADIARKLWWVWLGPDGVSPSLKDSIAETAARQSS